MKKNHLICLLGASALLLGIVPVFAEMENDTMIPKTGTESSLKTVPSPTAAIKPIASEGENSVQGSGKEYFACMAKATSSREDAFISGLNTFNSTAVSAYGARKSALAAAWASSDNRETVQKSVNEAEQTFRNAYNNAQKQWNSAQQTIAQQFNADRTACVKLSTQVKTSADSSIQSLAERIKQLEAQIKELMAKLNAAGKMPLQTAPQPSTSTSPQSYGY